MYMGVSTRLFTHVAALLCLSLLCAPSTQAETLGWVENVYLQPWGIKLRAKLDTGARTSSVHAENLERFDRDGRPWVRFTLPFGNGEPIVVERPVVRETRIKQVEGESQSRCVVELEICLDGTLYTTPVTLADRHNFVYPVLLGRHTLRGHVIVDPGKTFASSIAGCANRISSGRD